MLALLQVLTITAAAVSMALSLAHALELPGKMRLTKDQYLAVQPIYYPGFSIGGMAEPLSIVLTGVLVLLLSDGSTEFWLALAALPILIAIHAVYWLLTHPVNNFWLKDFKPRGAGAKFFAIGTRNSQGRSLAADWTQLRDRWEHSHVVRAVLGFIGFVLLAAYIAL